MAIQLERVEDHDLAAVVALHEDFGEPVDGVLEPALLGVDVELHALLRGPRGDRVEPAEELLHARVLGVLRVEVAPRVVLLEHLVRSEARDLHDDGVRGRRPGAEIDRSQDLVLEPLEVLLARLRLRSEVEDARDPAVVETFDARERVLEARAADELAIDRALDAPGRAGDPPANGPGAEPGESLGEPLTPPSTRTASASAAALRRRGGGRSPRRRRSRGAGAPRRRWRGSV